MGIDAVQKLYRRDCGDNACDFIGCVFGASSCLTNAEQCVNIEEYFLSKSDNRGQEIA